MSWLALALGLVLCVEGLVLALLPRRLEDLIELVAKISPEQRRGLGLAAFAIGVGLIWLATAGLAVG